MKTKVYNLIVLDETGSMSSLKAQTISGCNETIDTIRAAQEKYSETQEHYVSIYSFHSMSTPSRYLIKNVPAEKVEYVTGTMYEPSGCTPLYDAVGSTLVDLRAMVEGQKLAIGSVTIITDGMENDSHHYTLYQVSEMIKKLREAGWNFNFIGAGIDVDAVADSMHIGNRLHFENTEVGTRDMYERERRAMERYYGRVDRGTRVYADMSEGDFDESQAAEAAQILCDAETGYFDETPEETVTRTPEKKAKWGIFGKKNK